MIRTLVRSGSALSRLGRAAVCARLRACSSSSGGSDHRRPVVPPAPAHEEWSTGGGDFRRVDLDRDAIVRRLVYRAQMRGMREIDIVLGRWTAENAPSLSDSELAQLTALLGEESPDLYNWIIDHQPMPPEHTAIIERIREALPDSYHKVLKRDGHRGGAVRDARERANAEAWKAAQ